MLTDALLEEVLGGLDLLGGAHDGDHPLVRPRRRLVDGDARLQRNRIRILLNFVPILSTLFSHFKFCPYLAFQF